jgi:hypothetical protein
MLYSFFFEKPSNVLLGDPHEDNTTSSNDYERGTTLRAVLLDPEEKNTDEITTRATRTQYQSYLNRTPSSSLLLGTGRRSATTVQGAEAMRHRGAPGLVDAGDRGAALVLVPLLQGVHDARRAPSAHHPPRQPVLMTNDNGLHHISS